MKHFAWKQGFRRGRAQVILLVAATLAVWWWLDRTDGDVTWLTAESPDHAVAGKVLPLHIHVTGLQEASLLCVDLHWASARDASRGFLASGGAKPVGTEGGQFEFEIMVRTEPELRFVNAIIFLSPTGEWNDHTFVAGSDLIPVTNGPDGPGSKLVRLPVRQLVEAGGQVDTSPKGLPRLITGFILLAASVMGWRISGSSSVTLEASKPEQNWWLALAVVFALAGIWELSGLEIWVGVHARAFARAEDVYYPRVLFQKVVISLTIAASLAFLGLVWRKRTAYQPALMFFGLYLAISIINLLSLHSIDTYARRSWGGITLVEALKFVCAGGALLSVLRERRRQE